MDQVSFGIHRYNEPGNSYDAAYALFVGWIVIFYAVRSRTASMTNYDFTVISLNTSGNLRWMYRYNSLVNSSDESFLILRHLL
ncbi:MAG: hypothetical protein N2166_00125 [candidate division WOR-3 bacterium]|nr:hypothetical protein [candidate division WOR-3 bacterium]